jgi:hypothetical protein
MRSMAIAEQFQKDILQTVTATYDTIATQPARGLVVFGQKPNGAMLRLSLGPHLPLLGIMLPRSLVIQAHIRKQQIERLALVLRKPLAKDWPIRVAVTFIERDKPTTQTWEVVLPTGTQQENFGTRITWRSIEGPADREIVRLVIAARRAFPEHGSARAA